MPNLPNLGLLHSLAGTNIAAAYGAGTKSAGQSVQNGGKIRAFLKVVVSGGSALTTITIKAQHAYEDVSASYIDSPSLLDAAVATREIEHAYTVSQPGTFWFSFLIDTDAIPFLRFDVKANLAGQAGDTLEVWGRA